MVKHKKNTAKAISKLVIILVVFGATVITLCYTLVLNLKQIKDLEQELSILKDEEIILEEQKQATLADIKRLSDPTYMARYAREKHFYSKQGEIILKFKD